MAKISIIYYSATGSVHQLALAIEEGAASEGAEVRRRHVAELAPQEAIAQNEAWVGHRENVADDPVATLDDLGWADGFAFGSPTRFGNISSQLKQFLDTAGGLWMQGLLADKPASGFTSSQNAHGGQESTLLALYDTLYHWGSIIVPPGLHRPAAVARGRQPVRREQRRRARRRRTRRGPLPGGAVGAGHREVRRPTLACCGSGRRASGATGLAHDELGRVWRPGSTGRVVRAAASISGSESRRSVQTRSRASAVH